MSIGEKFLSVRSILQEHNKVIGEGNAGFIDLDKFFANIKAAGGTSEPRLKSMKYEDILACFPASGSTDGGVKPTALARDIAKVFRGKEDTTASRRPVSSRRAELMPLNELIGAFDPDEPDNPVAKRLKTISSNRPFIVYNDGVDVNVEATYQLLKELKQGYPPRDSFDVNGVPKKIYSVGDRPDRLVPENPIYHGRPLRPDGTCDQTGRSWDGVDKEVRQLIRIGTRIGEIKIKSIDDAHSVMDLAISEDAANKLRSRYKKTSLEFDNKDRLGNLPNLVVELGKSGSSFPDGKKVLLG